MLPVLPLLFGLVAALIFELVSGGVYGTEDIMSHTWVDMVFWGLIGAGVLVSLVNVFWGCMPCRLSRLVHAKGLQDHLCRNVTCS